MTEAQIPVMALLAFLGGCFAGAGLGGHSKKNPKTWVSQPLGWWNKKTGRVSRLQGRGYDYVSNATFQGYRSNTYLGGDFLIYSDMKVTKLQQAEFFLAY